MKSKFSWASIVCVCLIISCGISYAADFEVVASQLNNPRGLAFGPNGALYIAEAGTGGDGPVLEGHEGPLHLGQTGSLIRILNGEQTTILSDLPSLAGEDGSQATGASDVYVTATGDIYLLMGLGADPAARGDAEKLNHLGDQLGHILHLPQDSSDFLYADVSAYEEANNPDGGELDSNPFSFTMDGDKFIVADAGGNDVLQVSADGSISTLAMFPDVMVQKPPFLPQDPPTMPMQAVPNAVTVGPDGAYYVAQLTGFPFPMNAASIYRVEPGQEPQVYATGFTNLIGIKFDQAGNLYALEIRKNSLLSDDTTGALLRINSNGKKDLLMDQGLVAPTGLTIGPDGMLYISNHGVTPGEGEVIKVDPANLSPISEASMWESY